ncbi:MAG: class I SAM-dependent methyltransferase [Lachnospiraceae bacterium]|nr:class I SAM-dependent methyltransferase [Lachnospiraceae bacterium]
MDKETQYEKFLGVKTNEEVIIPGNTRKLKYSLYEASEYEGLEQIFDLVSLKPEDTIVDFGCGMGRVLFFCNQRFLCKVKGIEYDRKIFQQLLDNAEFYHVRFREQKNKFTLLNIKAEEYDIAPEDSCFYFFNPFAKSILSDVLAKILKSVEEHPRRVTIIFYYCTYDMMSAIREYPFKLEHVVKLPEYRLDPDEKAYVYSVGE